MPVDTIKDIAQKVAEAYLLTNKVMDESILESHLAGEIENIEILKRICELANQNVYLALYNDTKIDKSNIAFDIANYSKLEPEIQKSENAMKSYIAPPNDFRSLLSIITNSPEEAIQQLPDTSVKLAELHKTSKLRDVIKAFISDVESLRYNETKCAEQAFDKIAHDTKLMVANGQSIGDIAKVAARYITDQGLDPMKIAPVYEVIRNDLVNSGFGVKTEFTKISSFKINKNASMLKPVNEFVMSIEKISGINEMHTNLTNTLNAFEKVLKEEIKSQGK